MGLDILKPRLIADGDDVRGFTCGDDEIDDWVRRYAHRSAMIGSAAVYVSFMGGELAGFYTLSAASVERASARGWLARNSPLQVPVILLGRLEVREGCQGRDIGRLLLIDALRRSRDVSLQIGAKALVVEPLNDAVRGFYLANGFREIAGEGKLFAKLR